MPSELKPLKVSAGTAVLVAVVAGSGLLATLIAKRWDVTSALAFLGLFLISVAATTLLFRLGVDVFEPRNSGTPAKRQVALAVGLTLLALGVASVVLLGP